MEGVVDGFVSERVRRMLRESNTRSICMKSSMSTWLSLYNILEEGLMVKSFFDPSWLDLGVLGIYGGWGGQIGSGVCCLPST